ncbi:hypothetical protein BIWAKO_06996 [Bosea sp. BIWAKO-01]|nr:hypothetical protein BIWAKO_06996 [Bosea sp. BIWAKO-01]
MEADDVTSGCGNGELSQPLQWVDSGLSLASSGPLSGAMPTSAHGAGQTAGNSEINRGIGSAPS